mgnify:CR=1 FL=1
MPKSEIITIKRKDCFLIESFQLKNRDFFGKNIWTASEIDDFITSPRNLLLMAKINKKLVGISFFISNYIDLEIYTIFIEQNFRNRNIGSDFLQLAKRFCHSMLYNKILLEVNEKNEKALKFYLKNNFKKVGYRRGYYTSKNYENAFLMKLDV